MITQTDMQQLTGFPVGPGHAHMHNDKIGSLNLSVISSLEKAGFRLGTRLPTATEIIRSGSIKIN